MVTFPPFRLDLDEERLWKASKAVPLRRKPFAILRYLVEHPRRLVTHDELLEHVWSGAVVSDSAVRTHVHELRQALGEGVIETVIGRGYRFVADPVAESVAMEREPLVVADRLVVGRAAELAVLRAALDRAITGHRQMCFVTGEPGIGKTTLVDSLLDELELRPDVLALRGQNVEQHGTPEAYLAVIEMFGRVRDTEHGERVVAALLRHAPTFLAQIPHLIPDAKLDEILRRGSAGTEARMVRELMEALESLCMQQPLVIVLEDLQWSDVATLDLLTLLGQRRERAKLLVLATARREAAQTVSHPLNRVMRQLIARAGAVAVPLECIEQTDVRRFIDLRFPGHAFAAGFADIVSRITGGTPLFMVSVLDDIASRNWIEQRDGHWHLTVGLDELAAHRPDNVKQLIDLQLDRLTDPEQRLLEAGSVVGAEFSTHLVAVALGITPEAADELCDGLVRRSLFLRREGAEEYPNGELHTRYGVTHALVQQVCLERTATARRQRWHRAIAESLETSYGERCAEVAQILATHFDHGHVPARAVHYYVIAAERTALRFATADSLQLFRSALPVMQRLPATAERDALELRILGGMAPAVLRTDDQVSKQSLAMFDRMIELGRTADASQQFVSLANLAVRHCLLGNFSRALAICDELDSSGRSGAVTPGHVELGTAIRMLAVYWRGDIRTAYELLAPLVTGKPIGAGIQLGILGPTDLTIIMRTYASSIAWMRGDHDQALAEAEHALALAQRQQDPYAIGLAHWVIARTHFFRRDPPSVIREVSETILRAPTTVWHAQGTVFLMFATSHDTPLDDAAADDLLVHLRSRLRYPMGTTLVALTVIAALQQSGHVARALAVIDEMLGFAHEHDERVVEPELLRLRGTLIEASDPTGAEAAYREAHALARSRGALSFELRAATSLAAMRAGRQTLPLLEAALAAMPPSVATPDVVDARALVQRLA